MSHPLNVVTDYYCLTFEYFKGGDSTLCRMKVAGEHPFPPPIKFEFQEAITPQFPDSLMGGSVPPLSVFDVMEIILFIFFLR